MEDVEEDLLDMEAIRGYGVLRTTLAFLAASWTRTATPTGGEFKILLITQGKLMDMTTQQ